MADVRTLMRCMLVSAAVWLPTPSAAQSSSLEPALSARIDSVFAAYTAPGSPGCAVGVYRGGAIAFARGYGLADLQHAAPITPSTPFTTGSLSKQFTAASVLWLAREGKLSLDDPVRRHVPELDPMHDAGPVTVRQLIHHTSGMRDWWALVDLAGMRFDDGYRPEDVLALAARQKALNFPPGSAYAYSNTSYIVLGMIVERVSGASLRAFADSVFFRPLGMPVTRFLDDHTELIPGRAAAYAPRAGGGHTLSVWANDLVGQGGVVTTLAELQRWDENFYTGRVGGESFVRAMEVPGRLTNDSALTYAYGVNVDTWRGVREVSHTGSTGGFRSALFRYPAQHTSVALLCNVSTANTTTLAHRVAEIVLGPALSPAVRASPAATAAPTAAPTAVRADSVRAITPAQREAFSGRWYSEELDVTWEIRDLERGGLQLLVPRRPVRLLRALGEETLGVGELQLVRTSGETFTLNAGRVRGVRFERVRGR